jgi:uncharacterized membrane protein YoaK (UPF0700 family)
MKHVRMLDGVLVLLAAAAGWLDGTAYLRAHVFIANMTGNTVLLGLGIGHHPPGKIVRPIAAIAAFVLGALAGSALTDRGPSASRAGNRALAVEAFFLAAFAVLWFFFSAHRAYVLALIAIAAFGMGLQQAATERVHPKPQLSTTYQGGTVEKLGTGIYEALKGSTRTLLANGSIWIVYLASAIGVAALGDAAPAILGVVPFAAVLAAVVAIFALTARQRTNGG